MPQPAFDQNGRPAVNFRFNPSGARKFGDYTADHIGQPFAIVLDNEVISAPVDPGPYRAAARASSPATSRSRNRPTSRCCCAPARCRPR